MKNLFNTLLDAADQNTILNKMLRLKQKDLGGSHLWIKDNGDCLTIYRAGHGKAAVEFKEGEWSKDEINTALSLYETTEAANR